ncbi:MAG: beta-ketoacyl synthase chain length factor [Bacteroides sp.]|nr:beta-ketoacyl synthase chain length factor [Prevotella sp.]MCM1408013.1 beta-ketoacyl synthase chain length factor [Treponema brennaborense]MCM1468989.1 beta-ketoacyl synthase chain length factor [Bacteroides sp.]
MTENAKSAAAVWNPKIAEKIAVTKFSAWAPGLGAFAQNPAAWHEWAENRRSIDMTAESPAIPFADPLLRRRLSQLTKMTVQIVHDVLPDAADAKMVFSSFRGEIARQFSINKMLIEEHSVMPASFSLSVFNAPPAMASIILGLQSGYSAVYPAEDSILSAIAAASAAIASGAEQRVVFVYADECIPELYGTLRPQEPALAFAVVLSASDASGGEQGAVPLLSVLPEKHAGSFSPADFLKRLILLC